MENNALLTVRDVQERLQIPHKTAYELFHRRNFPALRFSRKLYVREKSLERYLSSLEKSLL